MSESQQFTHLFQQSHNRVVAYSPTLARRRDMRPCFIDDDGNPVDVAQVDVLPQHAASLANALRRLDELEVQYKRIVDAIAKIPGGEELMDAREPMEAAPIPQPTVSAGEAMGLPAPGSLAAPTAPQSPAPVAPGGDASAGDPEAPEAPVTPEAPEVTQMKAAEEAVGAAEKNVASKQQFLADQTTRLEKAREALPNATGDAKQVAEQELKSAGIKVKSATTKLASANLALSEATDALDALTAPPAE